MKNRGLSLLLLLLCFCPLRAAWAQISWVSSSVSPVSASAVSSLSITTPASIAFADLLIAQITVNPGASAVTAPTGWSFVDEVTSGSVRQRIYYRVTNASEPASFSFGIAPSARAAGAIIALRGAEMVPPIFASYSERSDTGNALIADSVNSTRNNSFLLTFFSQANGNGSITPTLPLTSRFATATGSGPNGVSIAAGSELLALAGPSGPRGASSTQNTDYVSQVIALRPAVSTCVTDDFQRTQLGSNWAVTRRQGAFTPAIVNNRMRMTQAVDNQSTAATLQSLLPAAGNLVTTEFRYFAYGGNGADGLVFVLSDASVTPQPGGYGGSLGYAPRTGISGFSGGWLGVGLDEFGNYSNNGEGRSGRPPSWTTPNGVNPSTGTRPDAVVVRGSLPNYYFLAGTNTLLPEVDKTPAQGHLYRVTVDSRVSGEAWILVERDTGSGYGALIPRFNVLAANSAQQDATGSSRVPTNFYLSFTGSTGGSTNIHEFDDFSACALALDAVVPQIDHFRFYHDGTANTCTPEPVRLQACANSDCSSLYTGAITAQLAVSASGQWQDSAGNPLTNSTVSFSGGSVNLRLSQTSAITQTLSVSSSTPVTRPLSVPMCLNSATNAPFTNCNLVFSGATSFTFGSAPANVIPAQEAGVESAAIRIQANNSACSGTPSEFNNKTVAVQFWFNYLDPQASTVGSTISGYKPALWLDPYEAATNTTPMFFELPTVKAGAATRSVYFNTSGIGYFKLVYPDVGQLQLSAEVTSLGITGNAAFVVKPYEFLVDNVLRTSDSAANPAASDASGNVFIQAGQDFSARITARNAAHKITDNSGTTPVTPLSTFTSYGRTTRLFGKEAVPEGVRLFSNAAALLPSGGNNPAIGNRDIGGGSFGLNSSTLGQATVTNLNWPEVGIIRLQPRILQTGSEANGDYLGAGDVTRYTSPNIGRFIPRGFVASGQSVVPRSDIATCAASSFTYLGEPFLVSNLTLNATATGGTTTQNYAGAFAKLDLSSAASNVSNLRAGAQHGVSPAFTNFYNATPASNRLVAVYGGSSFTDTYPASDPDCPSAKTLAWCKGRAQMSLNFTINRAAAGPDGPFVGAILGLSPVDDDGVRMSSLDFQRDYAGSGALAADGKIIATLTGNELRYGRLRLIPGQGSDAAPFIMKTEAQYWDGAYWRTNLLDSCTSYVTANAACSGLTSVSAVTGISKGYGSLILAKPSGAGTAKICLDMASSADGCTGATSAASLDYLRGNWGALSYDKDPFGYVEFGRVNSNTRGNWGFIYRRENF